MFVRLNDQNQVVEIVPFDDISDKFHPDVQVLFYPTEEALQLKDYVELQPRTEMQDVVDEEGNVTGQVEVQLKPLAVKIEPPAVEPPAVDLRAVVRAAIAFGNAIIEEFTVENIMLGITQDNMTETVLDIMAPASEALRSGSLYAAITRIKAIPAESKDAKYITDVR